jgi:alkylhydroperoxidase family enzyme
LIKQLIENLDSASIEPKLKSLLAYARKLTLNPSKMLKVDAEEVYRQGWDERALFDTVQVCALFNMMNRIVDGTGVSADTINAKLTAEQLDPLRKMSYPDLITK